MPSFSQSCLAPTHLDSRPTPKETSFESRDQNFGQCNARSLLSFKSKLRSRTRSAIQSASLLGFWHSANDPLETVWFWRSLPTRYRADLNYFLLILVQYSMSFPRMLPLFLTLKFNWESQNPHKFKNWGALYFCIYDCLASQWLAVRHKFTWASKVDWAHKYVATCSRCFFLGVNLILEL